jgi:hypothetical protein
MKNITTQLILLFVYVTIVFNLEEFTIPNVASIKIHNFLDILILVMIVFTIVFRIFSKLPKYANIAFWLIVYFLMWFLETKNPIPQVNLQITLVEVLLVTMGVILVNDFVLKILEQDTNIDNLISSSFTGRTLRMDEAGGDIKNELLRSRRYQHPMTVMVVKPEAESIEKRTTESEKEIQHSIARRYTLGKISEQLNLTARRPDIVIKHDDPDKFIILCPETTAESSYILAKRIKEVVASSLSIVMQVGIATFPDDALTFEELLRKADIQPQQIAQVSDPSKSEDEIGLV